MSNEKKCFDFDIWVVRVDLAQRKLYPSFVSSLQKGNLGKHFCCHRYCSGDPGR